MATMSSHGPEVGRLLKRIGKAGYGPAFVRRQLPDWWTREVETEAGALTELKIRLSRRLGLDLGSLLGDGPVSLALPKAVKFKRALQLADAAIGQPFLAYSSAIARAVAAAMPSPSTLPSGDPDAERAAILKDKNVKWVSLNALLRRCWTELGIAVVQVTETLPTAKGFDAATFRIDDRSVIVLAKRSAYPAWTAFYLAHELGHLALRHIAEGEALVDEAPDELKDADDAEEAEANRFGLALLGGSDLQEVGTDGEPNVASLASTALSMGTSLRIDPGHLILRFARRSGEWEVAQGALARLSDGKDVAVVVNEIAGRFLDFSRLGEDARTGLFAAMGREL